MILLPHHYFSIFRQNHGYIFILGRNSFPLKSGIGDNIAKARKMKGMTQADLAKEAGISRSYLQRVERETVPAPHKKTLARIANALGVELNDLLKDTYCR